MIISVHLSPVFLKVQLIGNHNVGSYVPSVATTSNVLRNLSDLKCKFMMSRNARQFNVLVRVHMIHHDDPHHASVQLDIKWLNLLTRMLTWKLFIQTWLFFWMRRRNASSNIMELNGTVGTITCLNNVTAAMLHNQKRIRSQVAICVQEAPVADVILGVVELNSY